MRSLEYAGHTVSSASDSAEAVRVFISDGPFDLLVTDMVMPGPLQGEALVARQREAKSDLPVVFVTGYVGESSEVETSPMQMATYLPKSDPSKSLRNAVGDLLERSSAARLSKASAQPAE